MTPFEPLSHTELVASHCRHMTEDDQLSKDDIAAQLQALPGWRHHEGALRRSFDFANFHETMAFVNAIAWFIHREDHHPELGVSYNRVGVAFNTHSAKGVSLNDFICAAKTNAVYGS